MAGTQEPKPERPDASDTERTVSEQAKQQPPDEAPGNAKPDEGIRPADLTSENDGGEG